MPLRMNVGRPGLKAALAFGAALTFGIWLFVGYYFMRRVEDIETRTAAVNARYMRAQEMLSAMRAQLLLGSVAIRDFLLDPSPSRAEYRAQLEDAMHSVDRSFAEYAPVLDSPDERDRIANLQREVGNFRRTMLEVLSAEGPHRTADARALLRTKVVPKRETVIRLSEDVQALNRAAFIVQQRDVAEIYGTNQRRLWQSLGLALAASLLVGLLVAFYAGSLEERLRDQRAAAAKNASDLQQLSAKLITVQEEERRMIARELHDEVGQVLTAVRVELAHAQRTIEAGARGANVLEEARSITETALATVRDLSHVLHPALLDDLGLAAAVESYVRGFSRRYDIQAELLQDRMDGRLAREVEASAYRIIQEALTNIAKHARAKACRVYLQRLPGTILITIEDDGVGFDETALTASGQKGLGLISIRERVLHLAGSLRLEGGAGRGARVTVELPARV